MFNADHRETFLEAQYRYGQLLDTEDDRRTVQDWTDRERETSGTVTPDAAIADRDGALQARRGLESAHVAHLFPQSPGGASPSSLRSPGGGEDLPDLAA